LNAKARHQVLPSYFPKEVDAQLHKGESIPLWLG